MAARFEALNRLWNNVRESSHDFKANTDVFPILDTDKLSRTLELPTLGVSNGTENKPSKAARSFDEVEQRIISRVEDEKKSAYQVLEDQFNTFDDRLRNLDFEGHFGLIRQANFTSLSDFKAEVTTGQNHLHGYRRDLQDVEQELTAFRKNHKLDRAARISSSGFMFFKIALLVVLLLLETALNGSFLAAGSEQGILGGVTLAFTVAALNIGSALLLSFFAVRLLVHRSFFKKLLGLVGLGVYIVLAILINLGLAHYREVSAEVFSDAGRLVIDRLSTAPADLSDINSWVLFGLGLLFSIIAFIDGCMIIDPYPGYANVQKRVQSSRATYNAHFDELIENLRTIRDDHNEKVELIIRDLSKRRQEFQAIIAHRTRIAGLFTEHQNHLERSANTLLTIYRDANRGARKEDEPKYWSGSFKLERIKPNLVTSDDWNDAQLAERIRTAQTELSDQMKSIGLEFEEAVGRYRQLDTLFPGV